MVKDLNLPPTVCSDTTCWERQQETPSDLGIQQENTPPIKSQIKGTKRENTPDFRG
jgi:hypothetical protein